MRRFSYGAVAGTVAAAMVAAGAPHAATAKKKKKHKKPVPPACATWTDATGDSVMADGAGGQPADPTLDIDAASFVVKRGVFTAKIHVPEFSDSSTAREGYRYDAWFMLGEQKIGLFAGDGKGWTVLSNAFAQQGIQVDDTYVKNSSKLVTMSVADNVVSLAVNLADLDSAAGATVTGTTVSGMAVQSSGDYEAFSDPFDGAAAPEGTTTKLVTCTEAPAAG
jgi:hypothetical protein